MPVGYSGTPLAKKLSLKDRQRVWWEAMPESVRAAIDAAHVFVTSRPALEEAVQRVRPLLAPSGFVWVSWPKKASKVPTDITEDVIREVALPTGLVDTKVCAVDATWSGLKLMIRREHR